MMGEIGTLVIGGPTASGKSALAQHIAASIGGVIINADSMQLYRELRILTARPTPQEEALLPHRLFGVLSADQPSSVGRWLELARVAIDEAAGGGQPAIVVGGTGLYLYALLHGLAAVPIIPSEVRAAASKTYDELGGQEFHRALSALDPKMAERLRPHDRQRLVRAFEVVRATGRSLAAWQADPPIRVHLPQPVAGLMLLPPRAEVYARIEGRLDAMVLAGALEELRELQALRLSPELPLLKAVAVRELLAHLEGELDLAAALTRAKVQTRRYAKRQLTWLRHRMPELTQVPNFGDTPEIRKRPWLDWLGKSAGRAG